jgi:hypothetical protein
VLASLPHSVSGIVNRIEKASEEGGDLDGRKMARTGKASLLSANQEEVYVIS